MQEVHYGSTSICCLEKLVGTNTLFQGDENARVPLHNVPALTKQTFKYVGCMLGASLVNGGPAPNFFANAVADYITFGIEKVKVKVEEVSEAVLKEKLIKVSRIEHKWFLHVIYVFFLKASECF